jgi:hypothetical protein
VAFERLLAETGAVSRGHSPSPTSGDVAAIAQLAAASLTAQLTRRPTAAAKRVSVESRTSRAP